jgi:peptide deformylase
MANRPILTADEPILPPAGQEGDALRRVAASAAGGDGGHMREAPGIGLAANQIGVPLQVAVIELEDKVTELINPEIVRPAAR